MAYLREQWLLLCALATGGALAGMSIAMFGNVDAAVAEQQRAAAWHSHTQEVLIRAEQVDTALNRLLRGQRGFVLTGSPVSLALYRQASADYRRLAGELRALTADNRDQHALGGELERRAAALFAVTDGVMRQAQSGREAAAVAALRSGQERHAMEDVSAVLDRIKAEERQLLFNRAAESDEATDGIRRKGHVILFLNGALLLGLGAVALALVRARRTATEAAQAAASAEVAVRESERQYRLLADNASDVILRTGAEGHVLYVSPSCLELSGHRPEELIGRMPAEFIHPDDHPDVHAAHLAIVTGAMDGATVEYRLRHKDKGWVWLESHMRPWREPDADDAGIISAIRDISRRKALEAELVASRDAAESAARVKTTFLANMSHEIRTPMNGVIGFTESMLKGELSPEQRRRAELIADSGRSMMRLLNDVLDLSKVEAGQMTVAREPFNLPHALQACVRLVTPAMEQKGLRIACELSDALPRTAIGDGLRLRQVLLNLLGNAAKFTEQGSVVLAAWAETHADGQTLVLEVRDTGIGIAPERQDAIFEAFVQADAGVAGRYGGTGLGLSISAKLARLMGGALTLNSVAGEGSTFRLSIPLVAATEVAAEPVAAAAPRLATGGAVRRRVLVAEDHDVNQLLIGEMLDRLNCPFDLAYDGEHAIALVRAAAERGEPYALVLMDVQMPRLDGLGATSRLREAGFGPEELPIVALTANAYAEDAAACLSAGMQAHLAKPVQLEALSGVLDRWAGGPGLRAMRTKAPLSGSLQERFRARRAETLAAVDRLGVASGQADVTAAAELLHKLAGTAGMFGEAELGDRARELEAALLQDPAGLKTRLAIAALQRAAAPAVQKISTAAA